jgi:hypothetical protein
MRSAEKLGLLTILCILLLIPSSLAVAKVLPGPAIVAHAEGTTDEVNWSSSLTVCIGEGVHLSAYGPVDPACLLAHPKKTCMCNWSYDLDYESDPHTFCAGVGFTWKYTKDGVEHNLGNQATVGTSFDEPGTYTCVVTVSDGEPPYGNDGDATASVTVTVGEITSLSGREECVLCLGQNYTWNVEACCCDDVVWSAPSGNPSSQAGGCTFTTAPTILGSFHVTATCGSSHKSSREYTVQPDCTLENASPDCVPGVSAPEITDPCQYGAQGVSLIDPETPDLRFNWDVCFDCGDDQWEPRVTQLELGVYNITESWGRDPASNDCASVDCLLVWLEHARQRQQGQVDQEIMDQICANGEHPLGCWSPTCADEHEDTHQELLCQEFKDEASQAIAEISNLGASAMNCNAGEAMDEIRDQVEDIVGQMLYDFTSWALANRANLEESSYAAEEECLLNQIGAICGSIEDCPACE